MAAALRPVTNQLLIAKCADVHAAVPRSAFGVGARRRLTDRVLQHRRPRRLIDRADSSITAKAANGPCGRYLAKKAAIAALTDSDDLIRSKTAD
ncbi:hypothetical protein [Paenibacillus curdlanolyticus]|uniref:hypothetical protein n=1 Tax=Paenibacillus curdlanolyticus TaxID=59840 RepID=UPI000594D8F7|nr:hypothetical protein [Paenibacillus curdlanolyticus]